MARLGVVILSTLLLALCAGLVAPAGAVASFPGLPTLGTSWNKFYWLAGDGDATAVAAAGRRVAFSCGYEPTALNGSDIVVRRGSLGAWTRRSGRRGSRNIRAEDVAVGPGGVLYVAGSTRTKSGLSKAVLLKYSFQGRLLWARQYAGPAGATVRALVVEVDAKGRVFVAGQSQTAAEERCSWRVTAPPARGSGRACTPKATAACSKTPASTVRATST